MERPLTGLPVSLRHPMTGLAAFTNSPLRLQYDTRPLLVNQGQDAHLLLKLPCLSRHLYLEPYLEKGSSLLTFCLKALSHRGCTWVNGHTLRYLGQVPLSAVKVAFSGVQMVIHIEGGISLEACCFHLSPLPLIYRLRRLMNMKIRPPSPPAVASLVFRGADSSHLGFLQGPSQTRDSSSQPNSGRRTEIQLQREPPDSALC
ncbi:LOW QUALITY PROTEIN: TRAF-interacting protein with FHA domain-containing protein B [Trichechus inunguis]